MTPPCLHVVTTDEVARSLEVEKVAEAMLDAAGEQLAIHLRFLRADALDLYHLAGRLAEVARRTGGWCVVNGRVDVALAAGAQAAQLGAGLMSGVEHEPDDDANPALASGNESSEIESVVTTSVVHLATIETFRNSTGIVGAASGCAALGFPDCAAESTHLRYTSANLSIRNIVSVRTENCVTPATTSI